MTAIGYPYKQPEISVELIKAALRGIRYSLSSYQSNPLEKLLLVELMLHNPDLPVGLHNRTLVLQQILVDLITDTYVEYQRRLGLPIPKADADQAEVTKQIKHDLATDNIELIAWSWLYHLYVRIDLDMSLSKFWAIGGFDETQRRYQRHALRRLVEHLYDLEWEARKLHRKHYLYLQLPIMTEAVVGRDEVLSEIQKTMNTIFPVRIQVVGETGIGKTAVIRELLYRQIKEEKTDDLFWLHQPQSVQQLKLELCRQFNVSSFDLADSIAANYRVVLVLDELQQLEHELEALNVLLNALPHFMIFIIHHRYLSLPVPTYSIALQAINPEATCQLLYNLQMMQNVALTTGEIESISIWANGNPGRVLAEFTRLVQPEQESA